MDKTINAVNIFNKLAKLYESKFMDVNLYGDSFDVFCNNLKKGATVLELACGPGNITKYLLNKRPDLKILATDLAPNMIALARINNPSAEFKIMDCRDVAALDKIWDAIMCGFCLPYLSKNETIKLIHNTSKILNAKGLIFISTIEDDYSRSGFKKGSTGEEIFMHYYLENDLVPLLKENGFKIIKLQRKVYPAADGTNITDLIIIAEKLKIP